MEIEITGLSFRYPKGGFQLRIPSLGIPPGRAVAITGASGSGKSTLLRLVAGIHRPDGGGILLDGVSLPDLEEAARRAFRIGRIGFIFQDFQLIEYLNVEENIRLPFRIHPSIIYDEKVRGRLGDLLEITGLSEKRRSRPGELSIGEMQRIAVCRALLPEPRLVLADEPTGNLDPSAKDRVMRLLLGETRRLGTTLLVVTHERDLPEGFDRVVDIKEFQGRADS